MIILLSSIVATILVSLISLAGILLLGLGKKRLEGILFLMISFSAGALMGGAFFHLLPEAIEKTEPIVVFKAVIIGFVLFYLLERVLRWHHCHEDGCETHKHLGYQNLFGDGVHNFIDGLIIVSSFAASIELGVAVTLSVVMHEIPQEISDFGVLLYSGFTKSKAILYNLISALLAVVGAIFGFFLIEKTSQFVSYLLPLAAGGFIYIAASDLIPELHKERSLKKSFLAFCFFVFAIIFMLLIRD